MSDGSAIEWTDATWNPVRGCTKVSPGCKHCYAEAFSERFRGVPNHPFEQGFDLRLVPEKLHQPLVWHRPRKIFVNSMSDLFHEAVPDTFIAKVFSVIEKAHWHVFQVLTKRIERACKISGRLAWPKNLWMGASVESARYAYRSCVLASIPAKTRFLSVEPLLGPIPKLPLQGIRWVIVGGESGRFARPMDLAWARDLRDQCDVAGVAFFLKQLGGRSGKRAGEQAVLDGRRWLAFPEDGAGALTRKSVA